MIACGGEVMPQRTSASGQQEKQRGHCEVFMLMEVLAVARGGWVPRGGQARRDISGSGPVLLQGEAVVHPSRWVCTLQLLGWS